MSDHDDTTPRPGTLTPAEHRALDLTAELANLIGDIVADGPTHDADVNEFVIEIHHIQHRILAQAGARSYPRRYRLLGGVVQPTAKGIDDLTDDELELLEDDGPDDPRARDRMRAQRGDGGAR